MKSKAKKKRRIKILKNHIFDFFVSFHLDPKQLQGLQLPAFGLEHSWFPPKAGISPKAAFPAAFPPKLPAGNYHELRDVFVHPWYLLGTARSLLPSPYSLVSMPQPVTPESQ